MANRPIRRGASPARTSGQSEVTSEPTAPADGSSAASATSEPENGDTGASGQDNGAGDASEDNGSEPSPEDATEEDMSRWYGKFSTVAMIADDAASAIEACGGKDAGGNELTLDFDREGPKAYRATVTTKNNKGGSGAKTSKSLHAAAASAIRALVKAHSLELALPEQVGGIEKEHLLEMERQLLPRPDGSNLPPIDWFNDPTSEATIRLTPHAVEMAKAADELYGLGKKQRSTYIRLGRAYNLARSIFYEIDEARQYDKNTSNKAWGIWIEGQYESHPALAALMERSKTAPSQAGSMARAADFSENRRAAFRALYPDESVPLPHDIFDAVGENVNTAATFERKVNETVQKFCDGVAKNMVNNGHALEAAFEKCWEVHQRDLIAATKPNASKEQVATASIIAWLIPRYDETMEAASRDALWKRHEIGKLATRMDTSYELFKTKKPTAEAAKKATDEAVAVAKTVVSFPEKSPDEASTLLLNTLLTHAQHVEVLAMLNDKHAAAVAAEESGEDTEEETI